MRRRGLTLLEVIVSLALVLALTAIAMPAMSGRLGAARADSVAREFRSVVAQARGDAVRDSAMQRLILLPDLRPDAPTPRWRVILRAFRSSESAAAAPAPRFVGPVFDDDVGVAAPAEERPDRVLMELPRGSTISREPPAPLDEFGMSSGGEGASGRAAAGSGSGGVASSEQWGDSSLGIGGLAQGDEGLTLGILLPTGAAVSASPVYITLPDGDVLVFSLDPWTGQGVAEKWQPPREDEWAESEAGDGVEGRDAGGRAGDRSGDRATNRGGDLSGDRVDAPRASGGRP